jgi:arginase family enzyme
MRAGAHHRPSVRLSIPTTSAFSADLCLAPSRVYFTSAALGGEHTIPLALLRALAKKRGPVGLVFFDAHVDTWKEKFGRRIKSAFVLRFKKTCSMAVEP